MQSYDLFSRDTKAFIFGAQTAAVQRMLDFLIVDCCRGRPDICMPFTKGDGAKTERKYNVLFLCVGNSARSIFAESLLRSLGPDRFNVYSAGTQPTSELNPFAVQVLKDKGHDVSVLRSKHMSEFFYANGL